MIQLCILHEDAHIIVCRKPAGVATETKKAGQQDMASLVRNYRHGRGEEAYAGTVHRLDQPVEGILVFGKDPKSTAALSRQLAQGSFSKIYLAVTEGRMPEPEGKLEHYLKKDGRTNTSSVVKKGDPGAKKAELYYQVLETALDLEPVQNLVKIRLLTGRHHQIRVQLAQIGTPLAGDRKYGTLGAAGTCSRDHARQGKYKDVYEKINAANLARGFGCNVADQNADSGGGLGLCACELGFVHPVIKKSMVFRIIPSQPVFQKFGLDLGFDPELDAHPMMH